MMIYLNEVRPEVYRAHLLDFSTGSVGPDVAYFASKVDLFFVQYSTRASLRTITMRFEFIGDTEFEVVKSISDFTAALMNSADFKMPDGFCYHCMLTKAGASKRVIDTIYTADFTFIGFRHLSEKVEKLSGTTTIYVEGNYSTSAVVKFIPNGFGHYIRIKNEIIDAYYTTSYPGQVTIDGIRKKVTNDSGTNVFTYCFVNDFPKLTPGQNTIILNNIENFSISYLPIYV